MFDWFRRKNNSASVPAIASAEEAAVLLESGTSVAQPVKLSTEPSEKGLFSRFQEKLSATRERLAGRLETLLSSVRAIDDDF
ncbi:MAG: hypothetical protein AMR96_05785 [Candidatus Adiutrix intracellularis]|nr:MAG: hypothetical protein AMR96_05785 [Candidatus Adiutrix intracellularis]